MSDHKITLGIDLGTTYSAVAYVDNHGEAKIVPNSENERITPSAVFFESEDNIIVGQNAKDEIEIAPSQVVSHVKREMGKKKEDVRPDENSGIPNPYEFYNKTFAPEEVSALILKKLKKDAENYFQGKKITDAVITVPAYFNDSEKQATKDAGKMAGFNVLQVINEPTAAAIAYGMSKGAQENQKVFVFDLGGGTFDVTILDVINNNGQKEINIINTDGDHRLGGKDWDDRIINYVAEEFINEHGEDPRENIDAMADMRVRSERVKKSLSEKESARMNVKTDENSMKFEVTREIFEELTEDLISRIEGLCDNVFSDTELDWGNIDTILLAGGSTRMPMIQNLLKRISEKEIRTDLVNPDECVAMGAAIQGTIINLKDNQYVTQEIKDKLGDVHIRDITSHTLGSIVSQNNKKVVAQMIKKGTPVPYTFTETFFTLHDNQTGVRERITEGESTNPENVEIIQEATLPIVNPMPKGAPIETTFAISADGMLTVTAKDITNNEQIIIQIDRKSNLTSSEVDEGVEFLDSVSVE